MKNREEGSYVTYDKFLDVNKRLERIYQRYGNARDENKFLRKIIDSLIDSIDNQKKALDQSNSLVHATREIDLCEGIIKDRDKEIEQLTSDKEFEDFLEEEPAPLKRKRKKKKK